MDDTRAGAGHRAARAAGGAGTPGLASVAALIGDRARSAMLVALLDGRALTAGELARAAAVAKPTASSHLAKLHAARLVAVEQAGRHRYFRLAGHRVAAALESLLALAPAHGAPALRPGPSDLALRTARTCYDHLAGEYGVLVYDSMVRRSLLAGSGKRVDLTAGGAAFVARLGVDLGALGRGRRPLCLPCLDWSERRFHLAGALGAALLDRVLALGWARRVKGSRALAFSALGQRALRARFPVQ